jgi:hypothetical protein
MEASRQTVDRWMSGYALSGSCQSFVANSKSVPKRLETKRAQLIRHGCGHAPRSTVSSSAPRIREGFA